MPEKTKEETNSIVENETENVQQRKLEQQERLLKATSNVLNLQKEATSMCESLVEKTKNCKLNAEKKKIQEESIAALENKLTDMLHTAERREERMANLQRQQEILRTSLVDASNRMTAVQERIARKREQILQRKLKKLSLEGGT